MALISKSHAQGSLGPYHDGLYACVLAAWEHWKRLVSEFHGFSRVGRRNVLHEFIVQEARTRFGDVVGVKIKETKSGRFLVRVERIVLFFKHVDSAFQPKNYPTEGAIAFSGQLPLPGVPKGPRVVIGYQLNELETELTSGSVIFLVGRKVMWDYEISKNTAGGVVIPMFDERQKPPRAPRVRPKQPKQPKKTMDDAKKKPTTDD
jgi:hypothetical protein